MAMRSGQDKVPVTYVDLSDDEERLILASLDPIGAMAVPDAEKLGELLESVDSDDVASLLEAIAAANEVDFSRLRDFEPVGEDETRRLDQRKPVTCPECGHEFTI
jgi:hypothetical protein